MHGGEAMEPPIVSVTGALAGSSGFQPRGQPHEAAGAQALPRMLLICVFSTCACERRSLVAARW